MKQRIICHFILATVTSLAIFSCKSKEKKVEPSTTDTAATSTTTQPTVNDAVADAVQAAPNFYKVAADSLGLRVLEVSYKPGDSSARHSHPDYVVYAKEGGMATFYDKDGGKMEAPMKAGDLMVRPAEVHSVKNSGKATINVIVIEVNRPNTVVPQDAATDASKVSANLYKLEKDTIGIKAIRIQYKPGQSSAMHSHPDNVLYVIEGGTGEFTDKDGKKATMELKKGMILVRGAESHSVKNVGKTTLRAIMVEVNRPRN